MPCPPAPANCADGGLGMDEDGVNHRGMRGARTRWESWTARRIRVPVWVVWRAPSHQNRRGPRPGRACSLFLHRRRRGVGGPHGALREAEVVKACAMGVECVGRQRQRVATPKRCRSSGERKPPCSWAEPWRTAASFGRRGCARLRNRGSVGRRRVVLPVAVRYGAGRRWPTSSSPLSSSEKDAAAVVVRASVRRSCIPCCGTLIRTLRTRGAILLVG